MNLRSRHSPFVRWTLLVALWMAFAPTLSYLAGTRAGLEMVELCSSFGTRQVWVHTEAPSAGDHEPADTATAIHCPFCLNLSQVGLLPWVRQAFALARLPAEPGDTGTVLAVRVEPLWRAHSPRAPPLAQA